MLRESSKIDGNDVALSMITSGNASEGNVVAAIPAAQELLRFAEDALANDTQTLTDARVQLERVIGTEGMVDAAAVIANFQRMNRIADSTGIPLDTPVAMVTEGLRDELGLNDFASAAHTPPLSLLKRFFGKILGKILPVLLRRMSNK